MPTHVSAISDLHRRGSLSFAIASGLLARLPHSFLYYGSRVGGAAHYWLAARKRRSYLSNMAPLQTGHPPWLAFQNQALNVLELLRASSSQEHRLTEQTEIHGGENIDRALGGGRGLILITFHLGNWELSGLKLALLGHPLTTVAGEQLRPGWSDEVKALKMRHGIKVVSPGSGLRELYRDLKANRIVALHIDGDLFDGGIEVPFMGRLVHVPRGPAHLSRVLQAPTAVAYCRRSGQSRLHLHIESPNPPPDNDEDEHRLTRRVVERAEQCILANPGQWCIFRKL